MSEESLLSTKEAPAESLSAAFSSAITPVQSESEFSQTPDDWRFQYIKEVLSGSGANVLSDGTELVQLELKQPSFHICETGDIDKVLQYTSKKNGIDVGQTTWRETSKNRSALKVYLKSNSPIKLPLETVKFIHPSGKKSFNLTDFIKTANTNHQTSLNHIFGMDLDLNFAKDDEVCYSFPKSVDELFSLFHELGHIIDQTKYQEKFDGSFFGLYEFSSRGPHGENVRLAELSSSERNAWAIAYFILKMLRDHGFIEFTDDQFREEMHQKLSTYEESTQDIPGNFTHSTHFLQEPRAQQRKEYRHPNLFQRMTHLKRKILGK